MRRWLVEGLLAPAIAAAALVGCWSLTADLDALSGGGDNGGPIGSSGSSGSSGSGDGGDPTDGGGGSDGSSAVDGSPDGDAAPPGPFCESLGGTHTLCDDFDVGALGAKWTKIDEGMGGDVSLVTDPVRSGPNAMRSSVPSGCDESYAQLLETVDTAVASASVAFDVSIASAPSTAPVNLAGITYATSVGLYRVDVGFQGDRLALYENDVGGAGFKVTSTATVTFPKQAWRRVTIDIVINPSPRVIAKVDGVTHLDASITPRAQSGAATTLEIGVYVASGCDQPADVYFDNVVYDLTPP